MHPHTNGPVISLERHLQQDRLERAAAALYQGRMRVFRISGSSAWLVASRDRYYTVEQLTTGWTCTCPDFSDRGQRFKLDCKHICAVRLTLNLPVQPPHEMEENRMSYHKLVIAGHLGRDPEMRFSAAGEPFTTFSLAANRQYTDAQGQPVKETVWFRVTVWGGAAEACSTYLHKGSLVLVEGRLVVNPETGGPRLFQREDGTTSAAFEVTASTVRFLSTPPEPAAAADPDPGARIPT